MLVTQPTSRSRSLMDRMIHGLQKALSSVTQRSSQASTPRRFEVHEGSRSSTEQSKAGGAPRANAETPAEVEKDDADSTNGVRVLRRLGAPRPSGNSGKGELRVSLLEGSSDTFRASLTGLSDKSMELRLDRPLTPGSLLKMKCGSTTWLGEAYRCERHPDRDSYRALVWLEHALYSQVNSRYASQNLNRRHAAQGA
jgi:hypothetical protein